MAQHSNRDAPDSNENAKLHPLAALVQSVLRSMAVIAGAVIVVVACLIVANVLLRYFTGQAIVGVEEIIQVAMVPVIFLAIGYCGQLGGHITVDILEPVFPRAFWKAVDPIIRILGAIAFAAMAIQAIRSGTMAGEFDELTNILRIPHQPVWYMLALGAAFAAAIELSKLFLKPDSPLLTEEESDEH